MRRCTRVCIDGREMIVYNTGGVVGRISRDDPHAHWCIGRPEVGVELRAFQDFCLWMPRGISVFEPFGGSGWHTAVIQTAAKPRKHIVLDISQDCVDSIQASLPEHEGLCASVGDAYAALKTVNTAEFDWVHADFNQLTASNFLIQERLRRAVSDVFRAARSFVTLTDSTVYDLEKIGEPWRMYYNVMGRRYAERNGYLLRGISAWDGKSAMYLFERRGGEHLPFVGLRDYTQADAIPIELIGVSEE